MKLQSQRKKSPFCLLLAAALTAAVATTAFFFTPGAALADQTGGGETVADSEAVAYSINADTGEQTNYSSISDAVNAGYEGATIVMAKDWDLSEALTISSDKKITIDMHGHIIKKEKDAVIRLEEKAELTLTSTKEEYLSYQGFDTISNVVTIDKTTGGLVTQNAKGSDSGESGKSTGIAMGKSSKLNLEGVTVGGNNGRYGGGIHMSEGANLSMRKGASIEHNAGSLRGGGIYASGKNATITMDDASISSNFASCGAGICLDESGARVSMVKGSKITYNVALSNDSDPHGAGGGIFFYKTDFELTSSDKTASISENKCFGSSRIHDKYLESGGGIHVDQAQTSTNKGLIDGITVKDNYSAYDGGGIELDQENTIVRNCTITGNTCKYEGGGIYVCNDDNTIENCTIKGNACSVDSGGNYEGGGIFVWHSYDIKLSGLCVIKGNTRGIGGSADDVMLRENAGATAKAYITGSLAKGSSVGVRTGVTGDRRIAKNFTHETNDCLFVDLDGYYVSYGTDEGGDAWQRNTALEFETKVNGASVGVFKYNAKVSVNGTSTDSSKVFKSWNADETTGLYPVSDYITDDNKYDSNLSFKMPQNEVNLAAEYVERTHDVRLVVSAPKAGSTLPSEGTLEGYASDGKKSFSTKVAISWSKKSGSSLVPASGKAVAGTSYVASVSASQDIKENRAFALDLEASEVKVYLGNGEYPAAEAQVDAKGNLSVTTKEYEVESSDAGIAEIAPISLQFAAGTSKDDFMKQFPTQATALLDSDEGAIESIGIEVGRLSFDDLFDDNDQLKPASKAYEFEANLKEPYQGKTVKITLAVSDADTEIVEAPSLSKEEGVYDTDDGTFKLSANSTTTGATIKYNLSYQNDGEWKSEAKDESCTDGINLKVSAGKQRIYKLEIWAEKDSLKSVTRTLYYIVKDSRAVETATLTISYKDTAMDGQHGTKEDETFDIAKDESYTIQAPNRDGYVFEKWLDESGSTISTDKTYKLPAISDDTKITAVYNPVVTGLDAYFDLPEADNGLASSATKLLAKSGTSNDYVDVTEYFAGDDGKIAITWTPSAEGKAEHATRYTAKLSLNTSSLEGVKYVLSLDPEVLVSGNQGEYGSYTTQESSVDCLNIVCPATGPYELPSLDALADESITYEQACTNKDRQDSGKGIIAWGLPDQVKATFKCGESKMLDITWNSISDLDKNATGEQVLTAKGTVTFPDYVDNDDGQGGLVSNEVSVKIKVTAPDKGSTPTSTDISAAKVTLSKTSFTYNGKAQKPSVKSVVLNGKTLKVGTDYTASIASGKKVGTYKVTIAAKGAYTGKATASFTVNPKGVTKFKVSKAKKAFKAKWKKNKTERSGVQVKYSTKKSMKNAKTVKAKGASVKAKKVKKLKKKTKDYVQVRAYKTVGGKTYYSGWSKVKTVKTK
ncbi:MAG: hypothetical protein Q4A43_05505 [Coriobacteriia bacterium]|nr:hypothetical protein [Coriobacteriia bacterium]